MMLERVRSLLLEHESLLYEMRTAKRATDEQQGTPASESVPDEESLEMAKDISGQLKQWKSHLESRKSVEQTTIHIPASLISEAMKVVSTRPPHKLSEDERKSLVDTTRRMFEDNSMSVLAVAVLPCPFFFYGRGDPQAGSLNNELFVLYSAQSAMLLSELSSEQKLQKMCIDVEKFRAREVRFYLSKLVNGDVRSLELFAAPSECYLYQSPAFANLRNQVLLGLPVQYDESLRSFDSPAVASNKPLKTLMPEKFYHSCFGQAMAEIAHKDRLSKSLVVSNEAKFKDYTNSFRMIYNVALTMLGLPLHVWWTDSGENAVDRVRGRVKELTGAACGDGEVEVREFALAALQVVEEVFGALKTLATSDSIPREVFFESIRRWVTVLETEVRRRRGCGGSKKKGKKKSEGESSTSSGDGYNAEAAEMLKADLSQWLLMLRRQRWLAEKESDDRLTRTLSDPPLDLCRVLGNMKLNSTSADGEPQAGEEEEEEVRLDVALKQIGKGRPCGDGVVLWKVLCGSSMYNLAMQSSDEDYFMVYADPTEEQLQHIDTKRRELYEEHGDDVEFVAYEARKFCEVIVKGNPKVLEMLFCPKGAICHPLWVELVANRDKLLSEIAIDQYFGWVYHHLGQIEKPSKRKSSDSKLFYHAFHKIFELKRILKQELPIVWLSDGSEEREFIMKIRRGPLEGDISKDALMRQCRLELAELERQRATRGWRYREEADTCFLHEWLMKVRTYFIQL